MHNEKNVSSSIISEIPQTKEDNANLSLPFDSLRILSMQLASENDSLRLISGNTGSALNDMQGRMDSLQKKNVTLQANSDADRNAISQLKQENSKLKSSIQEKDKTITNQKASIQARNDTIKGQVQTIKSLKAALDKVLK